MLRQSKLKTHASTKGVSKAKPVPHKRIKRFYGPQPGQQRNTAAAGRRNNKSQYSTGSSLHKKAPSLYNNNNNNNNNKDDPNILAIPPIVQTSLFLRPMTKSYSNMRPKWATDLISSLNDIPTNYLSPLDENFPSLSLEDAYTPKQHSDSEHTVIYSHDPSIVQQTKLTPELVNTAFIPQKPVRGPKNNMGLFIAYRGTGYKGSQIQMIDGAINTAIPAIEHELLYALRDAGYVTQEVIDTPARNLKWMRAARTDKGVHGLNIINCKLRIPYIDMSPEVAWVYKRALRLSIIRYHQIYPLVENLMINQINNAIKLGNNNNADDNNNVSLSINEQDEIENQQRLKLIQDNYQPQEREVPVYDEYGNIVGYNKLIDWHQKEYIPKLLTHNLSELTTYIKQHIALNITGDLTISPDMVYTLKRFGLYPEHFTKNDICAVLNQELNNATNNNNIPPNHTFTDWEQRLLALAVEKDNEWEAVNLNDDNENNNKDEKDNNNNKDERDNKGKRNNNNNNNNNKEEDPNHADWGSDAANKMKKRGAQDFKQINMERPRNMEPTQMHRPAYIDTVGLNANDLSRLFNNDYLSDVMRLKLRPHLPKQIHLLRAFKTINSFCSKNAASSRVYEYIIPSYVFAHIKNYKNVHDEMTKLIEQNKMQYIIELNKINNNQNNNNNNNTNTSTNIDSSNNNTENQTNDNNTTNDDVIPVNETATEKRKRKKALKVDEDEELNIDDSDDDDGTNNNNNNNDNPSQNVDYGDILTSGIPSTPPKELEKYRLSSQDVQDINHVLSWFVGTRNQWNFTSRLKQNDPSAARYIRSFQTVGTFEVNGTEFAHFVVHGDSFLLNQIRKMIGFTIGVVRGNYDQYLDDDNNDNTNDNNLTSFFKLKQHHSKCQRNLHLIYPDYPEPYAGSKNNDDEDAIPTQFIKKRDLDYNPKFIQHINQEYEALVSPRIRDLSSTLFPIIFKEPIKQALPIAPALGLLLDRIHYDVYDKNLFDLNTFASQQRQLVKIRDTITSQYELTQQLSDEVKKKEIYAEICVQELQSAESWRWLHLLNLVEMNADDTIHNLGGYNLNNNNIDNNNNTNNDNNTNNTSSLPSKDEQQLLETAQAKVLTKRTKNKTLIDVYNNEIINNNDITQTYTPLVKKTKANIPMMQQIIHPTNNNNFSGYNNNTNFDSPRQSKWDNNKNNNTNNTRSNNKYSNNKYNNDTDNDTFTFKKNINNTSFDNKKSPNNNNRYNNKSSSFSSKTTHNNSSGNVDDDAWI